MQLFLIEIAKGGISLAVTLIGLAVGWLVGQRLTYQWTLRQKRRELDLAAAGDFQRVYGEFFAVWKLWNGVVSERRAGDLTIRADLLRRAADAEGLVERLIVKLVTERILSVQDREVVGAFRQAYKQARKAIESNEALGWHAAEHPEYLAFKRLAVAVVAIIQRESVKEVVGPVQAFEALREITSNRHEKTWASVKTS
jgi:hypothetical protein